MTKTITIILLATLVFCTSACSGLNRLSGGNRNDVRDWINSEKVKQANAEKSDQARQAERDANSNLKEKEFLRSHPEVPVENMALDKETVAGTSLSKALNEIDFVTRYPGTTDPRKVYVKVGDYQLTAESFQRAIYRYAEDCRRASAYSGNNYKEECITIMSQDISAFAKMIKNEDIPSKTKSAALREASYRDYIDFGHAAKLARMHTELCSQQGNKGYVTMERLSAPCRDYQGAGM